MKKSVEIALHVTLWIFFLLMVVTVSKLFLLSKPDAPFAGHFGYVVFLELFMGLIFFYTTFFLLPWAGKRSLNGVILAAILIALLAFFSLPAMKIGPWEVMSSLIPHVFLIYLAYIFRIATK
jgi:hypothetical protein